MSASKVFVDLSAALLGKGHRVRFSASGRSMIPTIQEGGVITVEPVEPSDIAVGDIVLYGSDRGATAHRVVGIEGRDVAARVFIARGDASEDCDAPAEARRILGKVVAVERDGRRRDLAGRRAKLSYALRARASTLKQWISSSVLPLGLFMLAGLLLAAAGPAEAQVISGSYTGDGTDNRAITGAGFQPDVVIIKGNTGQVAVSRTSTMAGDGTKVLVGSTTFFADGIQSLDADGFTLGTDARVNQSGIAYYWISFKAAAGEMKVGSYTGNGTSQSLTGFGFSPEFVIVFSSPKGAVHRSSLMTLTYFFNSEAGATNRITSFDADGFSVGDSSRVNSSGVTYHYVAWNEVAGKMKVGSYVGDGTDDRDIIGLGFRPTYVITRRQDYVTCCGESNHKSASTDPEADVTLDFRADDNDTNEIQKLLDDGFQVGTDCQVNLSGKTYYWIAFGGPAPTAVRPMSLTGTAYEEGVLVQWRTGYEVDNLGFHLYREVGGQRVRVTPQLVAGSALFAGARTPLTAGKSYAWWDRQPGGPGLVRYWLEDVDLNGQRTWHGPARVVLGRRVWEESKVESQAPAVKEAVPLSRLGVADAGVTAPSVTQTASQSTSQSSA